jgi:DNA mismatch repair protein MutS
MSGAVPDSADTPLMRQYLEIKEAYPDCIVFFRLGDFYEMFFDDAVVVARSLDLTLTSRDKGKENPIPMCGVPHHASRHYLAKLVERGFKIAVAEQVEDPKVAKGIVRREVVRVVTPGTIVDDEQLDPKAAHYLVALVVEGGAAGLAHLDVTTGEFAATQLPLRDLADELSRLEPREVLHDGLDEATHAELSRRVRTAWTPLVAAGAYNAERAKTELQVATGRELPAGAQLGPLALRAAVAVVKYASETQPAGKLPLTQLLPYTPSQQLILDDATRFNLELFATIIGGKKEGSLLGVLDETRTSMGGRMLRRWLAAPLVDVAQIRRRHDAVEWLVEHASLRAELRLELAEVYDLERLAGRATLGVASPRDLAALARSLARLPELRDRLKASFAGDAAARLAHPELLELPSDLCSDVSDEVRATLVDEPPPAWKDGGFVRRGFSRELDELSDLSEGGKGKIAEIELRERERTGIGSLKVRYNRVFGYYLEITRSNLDRVPSDYVRKQTLANAERFVTAELADYEAKILGADERRIALELEAFDKLRRRVAEAARRLLPVAESVARLDALASLAEVAQAASYVRPEVDAGSRLEIEDGRHPVVEKLAAAGRFVPNDVTLDPDGEALLVITGPNMAGKSTAMRQTALIVVMAQLGSFVPARRARVGICDRVFTRVGASDNLARGESTFMVEMRETAHILGHATRRSLVVLDEIGRGTSTYDGLSIAWAVAEHIHDRIGARTMFATHYHELTALAETRPRVRNFSTAVREWRDEVVFLHKLVPGGASRSYGIQVARLAGLDKSVVTRARQILDALERGDELGPHALPQGEQLSLLAAPDSHTKPYPKEGASHTSPYPNDGSHTPPYPNGGSDTRPYPNPGPHTTRYPKSAVEEALAAADLDGMSPREAHAFLAELQNRLARNS